jgi:hypothetical protein
MRSHLTFIFMAFVVSGTASASVNTQSLNITIENTGDTVLVCSAAIAHWFSADLGEISPGASRSFSFGVDVASGKVFQLNEAGDEMAVQRVWCGLKGRDWITRAEIPMDRRAGILPAPVHLRCAGARDTTRCAAP